MLGREEEIAAIRAAQQRGERVIQLCGPAHSGKTELLLHVERQCAEETLVLDLGAFVAPQLEACVEALLDPRRLARSSLSEGAPRLELLLEGVGSALLLLDGVDECADEAAEVLPRLLAAAPGLRLLFAAREPVPGLAAAVIEVGPLPFEAEPPGGPALELLLSACSPEQRRRALRQAPALGALLERLGGAPLALRLASHPLAHHGPEGLLELLQPPLLPALLGANAALLTRGQRDALSLAAVFSGGIDARLFEKHGDGGEPAERLLQALERRGFLRKTVGPGLPRWRSWDEALAWLRGHEDLSRRYPEHCASHLSAVVEATRAARSGGHVGLPVAARVFAREQRNLHVAFQRLVGPAVEERSCIDSLLWLIVGLLNSHRHAPLPGPTLDEILQTIPLLEELSETPYLSELVALARNDQGALLSAEGQTAAALGALRSAERLAILTRNAYLENNILREQCLAAHRSGDEGRALELLRRTLDRSFFDPQTERITRQFAIGILDDLGRSDELLDVFQGLLRLAENDGIPQGPSFAQVLRLLCGQRPDDALRLASSMLERDLEPLARGDLLLLAAVASVLLADLPSASAHLAAVDALPRSPASLKQRSAALLLRGLVALLSGDSEGASRPLEEASRRLPSTQRLLRCFCASAQALALAQTPRAQALLWEARSQASQPFGAQIVDAFSDALALTNPDPSTWPPPPPPPAGPQSILVQLARAALAARRAEAERQRRLVVVASSGEWLRGADDVVFSFESRPILCSLLRALASARRERPGASLSKLELIQIGWPAERKPQGASATNRLHVALATLRKLGLGAVLLSTHDGWALDPDLVHVESTPEGPP